MSKRNRDKKKGLKVDLSGVEVGSKKALPEGTYPVTVESIEVKNSTNSGSDYLSFTFEVEEGDHKGAKLFHNCSLQPQALFNLKAVLLALGFEIPNKAFDLDTSALVGLSCNVEVAHEVYEGKKKARIVDFIDPNDEDDDDEDSEMDLESLDKDELKQLAEEMGISAKKIKKAKTEEALIELLEECDEEELQEKYDELFGDEDDDDGDDEEDEDDEDEDEDDSDYEEMSLKELKEEAKERGLKVKKGMSKEDIIELLEEDDEE